MQIVPRVAATAVSASMTTRQQAAILDPLPDLYPSMMKVSPTSVSTPEKDATPLGIAPKR
jgi:hypothetical protein